MSVNKVILVGRLGKDPETRYMTTGEAVTNVSMATSESWKGKNGEKQDRVEWHNLVFYRRLAEVAGEYLEKGSHIYVEGKIQNRKWQDKDGKDRYTTEIIVSSMDMLDSKTKVEKEISKGDRPVPQEVKDAAAPAKPNNGFDDFDSDIPF